MQQSTYSIRRLGVADLQDFKHIRLEALQQEPAVFSSNYAREAAFPDNTWEQRLLNPGAAFFGLYDGPELIGITGIIANDETGTEAVLIASYIRPGRRGHGLSGLLYQARIDWAKEQGFRRIVVSHRAGNEASRAANQRYGFLHTHAELMQWPDGQWADNIFYVLEL